MLLMSLLVLMLIHWSAAVPVRREVYRMPQNMLKALSNKGTVVMEAALVRALTAIDQAIADRSRVEASCMGCMPCLFQDCGQHTETCGSAESVLMEPTCEMMRQTQSLSEEAERRWALSQMCGFYKRHCSTSELYSDSCIRIMGESCSSRLLQCSLINAMQNLEPAIETRTKALCGQRVQGVKTPTQPRSRIMGGSQAPRGSWPWIVNLQLNGALMCGGVLLDSSWVLTAAHCFAGSQSEHYWTAVVGEFDITKADPDEQVMKVNRIITHPKFNPNTFNNDIALVELSSPVVLSERVMPVCLPSDPEPPPGAPCLVAGWGSLYEDGPAADVVMEAIVPLLSQNTCKIALGKQLLTSTMFCAGYLSGGIDSCQGDSGGPLILQDLTSGRFQLYGVTSWGEGCGEKGKPGVYTRVVAYKDWILSEIKKSFRSREPTCAELLKTSELSEEQRMSEFTSLCHFYMLSCPITLDPSGCQRLAQDNCQSRFEKCQLHLFLQTLLDLLQRADDYFRDKVDLTLFIQSLPQLVEHVYSSSVHVRTRRQTLKTVFAQRRHRRQLLGGQLHEAVCPGVAKLAQQVIVTKEMYNWILNITPSNLNMNFQEILVDINTKNEHGLYEARVKATVGGHPLSFYSLVGLENDSFYRSMPHIIALALDALKTQ
ncbi:serine protease 56 [Tachysurus vachellii]|uniref:serine protease 56 n=1 Tax=Tachysurus vachellii TaxID=175792 RepID=UPI00296A959C|nr:serine protease 56 [Tachysurus vachellii]